MVKEITKSNSTIHVLPATKDDPKQRKPDITTAKTHLGWEPKVIQLYEYI
jgi:nucleoside-diphosphate-sugar epimerase